MIDYYESMKSGHGILTASYVCFRTNNLKPNEEYNLNHIISIKHDVLKVHQLSKYASLEMIITVQKRHFLQVPHLLDSTCTLQYNNRRMMNALSQTTNISQLGLENKKGYH